MLTSRRTSYRLGLGEIARLLKPITLPPLCENPLVSVLTGNFNYARYLGEAIESVLSQTYTNFEMIVCDDGSTDESCDVVNHFVQRDPRVRLVKKQNGGQASALNAAYRECSGQIVCFLDADDRFLPEKLKTVTQALLSHRDSGFVGHGMFYIDADGRRDGIVSSITNPPSGWYGPHVIRYGGPPHGLAFGSAMCLRRESSDLIFPLPESFSGCADGVVMFLSPLMTRLIGIPVPLAEYRYHGRNILNSHTFNPESLARARYFHSMLRGVLREYVGKANPALAEGLTPFDESQGALLNAYTQARLRTCGGALSAYRDLLRAESFATLSVAARWFWRLSVILPRPVFRYALGPSRLRRLFWRALEFRRRHFAS